jgi:23S rRNA pseudouridine1911/1915/1917 synthase
MHERTESPEQAGQTLAASLRTAYPELSWSKIRQHIAARRVQINGELCLDPARRLKPGDTVTLLAESLSVPKAHREPIVIRHLDPHIVVVEKPAGISSVRHPAELQWTRERRELSPTLQDQVQWQLAERFSVKMHQLPRLRIVHRLDKETSGLLVFARSVLAERVLGQQFRRHTVLRRYLAMVEGHIEPQTIRSFLVRDRGDGRRGSTMHHSQGKEAITHVVVVEKFPSHTLVECRLETGRTHQIRIHLSEAGHPILGEKVYVDRPKDSAEATTQRLFLHAIELGFEHPEAGEPMSWTMQLPSDLAAFLKSVSSQ